MSIATRQPVQTIEEKLLDLKGTRAVTIVMQSEPKLVKPKSNPLAGRVVKVQSINGMAGFDYQAAVNRRREKEGKTADFVSAPAWFDHLKGALVKHKQKGTLYAYLMVRSQTKPVYYVDHNGDGQYTHTPIEKIKDYLYFPKSGGTSRQGIENPVQFRTIAIENILTVKGI